MIAAFIILLIAVSAIVVVARDPIDPNRATATSKQRRAWRRDRADLNPALRRRP